MTRRSITNTDIKVIPIGHNSWEKGTFLKISYYIEERNLIVKICFVKHIGSCLLMLI